MANPLINIKALKRDFQLGSETIYVLKGIDLQINKGEYVALMGPSGSGKSTLMNLLGCLDTPTSGTYILNGKDVSQMHDDDLAEIRNKEIGFVFQTFNLLPRTTALDNVALPMIYAGYSKSERNQRAIEDTIKSIQTKFGEGAIMKLGDTPKVHVDVIPTGSIGLDMALGVGGLPRGKLIS